MKITSDRYVGERVRITYQYPTRGVFCDAVSWTYEGTVESVLDLEENARAHGYNEHRARVFRGQAHVRLVDVTMTPDPELPLQRVQRRERVTLIGHHHGWEVLDG